MSVLKALKSIRKLFGPKGENWTQLAMAKKSNGDATLATSKAAAKWCMLGAVEKVKLEDGNISTEAVKDVIGRAMYKHGYSGYEMDIADYNDSSQWREIQKVLDEAITIACEQEHSKEHHGTKST